MNQQPIQLGQQAVAPPATATNQPGIPLSQLLARVKRAIEQEVPGTCWVIGEVVDAKPVAPTSAGHVYFELAEKDESSGAIKARAKCTMWAAVAGKVLAAFERATGARITGGTKLLCQVEAVFSPGYGFSLNVKNIDPAYTLGDLARRRKEILDQLTTEGLLRKNGGHELPVMPQRIAVISSATAAGYLDFIRQLQNNPHNYRIETELFQVAMQGAETEKTVYQALRDIYVRSSEFDVIVVIRGGGSAADLMWFDSYRIGRAIALSLLPVLTGIGHEQDETIADLVAHTKLKTPTAVAEFLIGTMHTYMSQVEATLRRIDQLIHASVAQEQLKVAALRQRLHRVTQAALSAANLDRQALWARLKACQQNALWQARELILRSRQRLAAGTERTLAAAQQLSEHSAQRVALAASRQLQKHQDDALRLDLALDQAALRLVTAVQQLQAEFGRKADQAVRFRLESEDQRCQLARQRLRSAAAAQLGQAEAAAERIRAQLRLSDPRNVLSRGFSIVRYRGAIVTSSGDVPSGGELEIQTANGNITATRKGE